MHEHRTAGTANAPPTIGNVHGLGVVDALRVDLKLVQLPWVADEIDHLCDSIEKDLAREQAAYDDLPDVEKEQRWPRARELEQQLDRRTYQLCALTMVQAQMPTRGGPAADVANPSLPGEEDVGDAITVVGPAVLITELIGGATRTVADALRVALSRHDDDRERSPESTPRLGNPQLPELTPSAAARLGALAAAAHALTDTLLHVSALQAYTFDPDYTPIRSDELA
jgi:hypothetical protein